MTAGMGDTAGLPGPIRYPIRIDQRLRRLLLPWGVRDDNAEVRLEGGEMVARFGRATIRTPISNIVRWEISGPYRWFTALGVRRSVRGGDFTFGGSAHGGLRMDFRERVRWTLFRVPALYVTLDHLEGFAAELTRRGIPGRDVRQGRTAGSTGPARRPGTNRGSTP